MESLWDLLPKYQKMNKGELFWNSEKNGFNLHQIYLKSEDYQGRSMLIILKTSKNKVIKYLRNYLNKRWSLRFLELSSMHYSKLTPPHYSWDQIYLSYSLFTLYYKSSIQRRTSEIIFTVVPTIFLLEMMSSFLNIILNLFKMVLILFLSHGRAALVLNDDLSSGFSQKCKTYNNEPLHGEGENRRFDCLNLEVYLLV